MKSFQVYYSLRKLKIFGIIQKHLDFTVYVKLPDTDLKAVVTFFRNLSWILKPEDLEREVRTLVTYIIRKINPKIFWDLGANIGYYSWLASEKVEEIIIFEPDPINVKLIKKTIKKNKIDHIKVLDIAVSDRSGEELFLVDNVSSATGSLDRINNLENKYSLQYNFHLSNRIKVKTKTLDDVLSAGYNAPDLIKIDVEGAEHLVLSGGEGIN
jgi:FkbM family methyltransferase